MRGTVSANEPLQPDTDDLLQVEPEGLPPAVDVNVSGPVRVQELPRKAGATGTKSVGVLATSGPLRILRADKTRASAVLIAADQAIYIAFSLTAAQDPSTSLRWPTGLPFPITTATDVYVTAVTGTAVVSFATELWATGAN